jgi:hypothetical protein
MKPSSCVRAAALAAVMSFGLPATAQITSLAQLSDAQDAEIYCLSDELFDAGEAFYVVAEAFLYDEKVEEAEAALIKAADACAARYKWDAAKQQLGMQAGAANTIVEYLVEELYADGAKDEHIDAIERVATKLSGDELNRFLNESWLEDADFIKRLDALLIAEKFPGDDSYNLETARLIIEAQIAQAVAASDWVRAYINKKN